jgi:F1F0 ATPase subunit 2
MIAVRFAFGILLGVFFYGGLWLTIRRFAATRYPLALSVCGLFLRMAITLAGFTLVMQGRWQNAIQVLAGFTAVRLCLRFAMRPAQVSTPNRSTPNRSTPNRSTPCI